jgi:hypothetical protein
VKPCRIPLILTGLIGGVVLLSSSGVYAGNEAYLYSSPSLAADEDRASGAFQYTVISYYEDELDGAKPGVWVDSYGLLTYENVAREQKSIRASSSHDKSTYLALGFISDGLTMDEDDTSDSRDESALSYGFGVNSSSSNFEYMMSMDQENNGVSAVGMKFTSEF